MYKQFFLITFLLILNALTTLFGMEQSDFPQSIPHRFPSSFATAWMLPSVELRDFETQKVVFDSRSYDNTSAHLLYNQLVEHDKRNKAIEPMILYTLSYMSYRGVGCEKNNNNALDYIMRATQQIQDKKLNNLNEYCSILNLWSILQISKAKAFNDVNTVSLGFHSLCFAAMFESPEAAYNLGLIHYFGLGQTNVLYPLAYKYFSAAAKKNLKEAAYFSAHMLYKGLGANKNYHDALVLQASQQELLELSDVQYERACIYLKGGFGVNCDYQKARNYFLRSAEQGNDKALIRLAYMSYKGLGVTRNLLDTCQLLEKAILKKNTKALQQIKKIAQEKKYIPAMYVGAENGSPECVQLLKEESLKENSLAKVYYGLILFNGVQDVVASKPLEGLQLIKQAAESGSSYAMYWYGRINFYGDEIIPKNKSEGLLWLEKASNCGSTEASEFLARYYAFEQEWSYKPRDVNKAFDYFVKASTQN